MDKPRYVYSLHSEVSLPSHFNKSLNTDWFLWAIGQVAGADHVRRLSQAFHTFTVPLHTAKDPLLIVELPPESPFYWRDIQNEVPWIVVQGYQHSSALPYVHGRFGKYLDGVIYGIQSVDFTAGSAQRTVISQGQALGTRQLSPVVV